MGRWIHQGADQGVVVLELVLDRGPRLRYSVDGFDPEDRGRLLVLERAVDTRGELQRVVCDVAHVGRRQIADTH